jgi:hypothetical protein
MCEQWMAGMGCSDFLNGMCDFIHPRNHQHRDLIAENMCLAFARMRCTKGQRCSRFHTFHREVAESEYEIPAHASHLRQTTSTEAAMRTARRLHPYSALIDDLQEDILSAGGLQEQEQRLHLFQMCVRMLEPHLEKTTAGLLIVINQVGRSVLNHDV